MWDGRVKEPITGIGSFLFEGEVQLGTPLQKKSRCIFDSSTQFTSTFTKSCTECAKISKTAFDPNQSDTYEKIQQGQIVFSEDGFKFKGDLSKDTICLGNGDVHTTVCLPDQRFYAVNQMISEDWVGPLQHYGRIDTVFGLGFAEPEATSYSFLARAVHLGYLHENVYAMSMASWQSVEELGVDTSHIQLGGYDKDDYKEPMVWYDLDPRINAWNLTVTSFKLDEDDLLKDSNSDTVV